MVERFENVISPTKMGRSIDLYILKRLKEALGDYTVAQIQPHLVSHYRDNRLKRVKPATVKRELGLLSRVMAASEKDLEFIYLIAIHFVKSDHRESHKVRIGG